MTSTSILLTGGTVVQHDANDNVDTKVADILIEGNTITKIAPSISAPSSSTKVIDCKNRIISPGFVDTHRHTWQSQLKGRHLDETLMQYLLTGGLTGSLYDPEDVFWGTLSGCLESIDAGTTSIVGHDHIIYSSDHARQGLEGYKASGVRAVSCVATTMRVKNWDPKLELDPEMLPGWWEPMFWALAKEQTWASGRVTLGLGFDAYSLPKEKIVEVFSRARNSGIKLITSHSGGIMGPMSPLHDLKLLGPDILLSHANNLTSEQAALLSAAGGHISSTPSTELQMNLGHPKCFEKDFAGMSSLGVDCHSATSSSIASEAFLGLQHARSIHNQAIIDQGSAPPPNLNVKVVEAFNLATIKGARAMGMGDKIGSIVEGKLADLVIWDKTSPGMLAAAEQDPVAAIIAHSSPRDVVTVIVDGVVRKENGKLLPVDIEGGKKLGWEHVGQEVLRSRKDIQKKVEGIDYARAAKDMGWA